MTKSKPLDLCTDEELLGRFCRGETETFGVLVRRYERELYGYLRRYLGDGTLAEDVFQNTFLQLYVKSGQYEIGRPVRPWLYTIATHQAIDALRRQGRHQAVSLEQQRVESATGESHALLEALESRCPDPHDRAADLERQEVVRGLCRRIARFPAAGADPGLLSGVEVPGNRRHRRHPGWDREIALTRRPGAPPASRGRIRLFSRPEPMDEHLVGYLLNTLDPATRAAAGRGVPAHAS